MSKNSKLKKKIGEKAYKFLSRNYNDDFLSEHLPSIFGLLSDIRYIQGCEYPRLKIVLNEKLNEKLEEKKEIKKTAKELLDEAGFVLHDNIKEKKDYLIFEKYYKENEKLCKFDSYNATSRYSRVFWITRKNIKNIKRAENPNRQDEYSTSCMSIGISKDGRNVMQITSRYNHTVSGCDNTYNSNLDNIVEGLTEAFNNDYNLKIKKSGNVEFYNFYTNNGKFYHYHYELNGKKYGDNTIDGEYYDPSKYLVFENFILDLSKKQIKTAETTQDSFVDVVNQKLAKGDKIQISKKDNNIELKIGSMIVIIDNNRGISGLSDSSLKSCGDYFLSCNEKIENLELPNLKICGNGFLYNNYKLTKINLPNLEICGDYFLSCNEKIENLELLNLKICGNRFLYHNKNLTKINLPNLEICGNGFLSYNEDLKNLELLNLKSCGNGFLYYNEDLKNLELLNLKSCGNNFLYHNEKLEKINLPNLEICGNGFLYYNKNLENLELLNLKSCGYSFLYHNENLKKIELPNLEKIELPNLKSYRNGQRKIRKLR